MAFHIDLETRSCVDLKKVGAHRYAEDPTTEIICASCRDDGPGPIVSHNAGFERALLNAYGAGIKPEDQVCTMARANALSLPASLEGVGAALRAPVQKDKAGHALMMQMCKPRTIEPLTWWEDEERLQRLAAYCDQDVLSECAIDKILPPLSEREQRVWVLDQTINDRGFAIDVSTVLKAQAAVEEARKRADRRMWSLTDGHVTKCTETARIARWISARGIPCESMAEGETDELITRASLMGDPIAAEAVELRQASAKTFKFPAMLKAVCHDGRIRGSLGYHGTISGRWVGRIVQPQNMKRIETEEDEQTVKDAVATLQSVPHGKAALAVDSLEMLCGPPLSVLSLCARPMIVSAPGKKLVGGDFSNIEGRVNAWLAGEAWKIEAFKRYDAGTGPDLYKVMAASILEKDTAALGKEDRQLWGKVPELACGYQGGVNAFHKMGANYGVRVEDKQAKRIVAGWREANPAIVDFWKDLQDAAIAAVDHPGVTVPVGQIQYRCANKFLFCCLPSGRVIAYPSPVVERKSKTVIIDGDEVTFDRWGVSFWGVKKGWRKLDLYGGMQCAHVVSGTARDILVESMFRVETAGYSLVLTVHDENLAEVDTGFGSAAEFARIMEEPLPWTTGLPVTAKAWEGPRYEH